MSEARIKARVAGRETAEVLSDMALEEIKSHPNHGADFAEAMIERLDALMPKRAGQRVADPATQPVARLGQTVIRFGSHCGKKFDQIPIGYLDWLCGEQETFLKELRAYLKHPGLKEYRR
jgi:hypothetical protein